MAWTTPGTAVAGDVLTAAFWNSNVRDNTNAIYGAIRRLGYQERTTVYTNSATTVASAANIFSSSITFTALGSVAYRVEFYCPLVETGNGVNAEARVHLVDGSGNDLGRISDTFQGASTQIGQSAHAVYYYTPSAGSVTLNMRGTRTVASGSLYAGTGGSGQITPMWFAVFSPDLT
jgi:hypothetical protein